MKMNKVKKITATLLALVMIISLVPMFAFAASDKEITELKVDGQKPEVATCYLEPNGKKTDAYDFKTARRSGLEVVETTYYSVNYEGLEDKFTYFWGKDQYLLSIKLKVNDRYDIPEDLSKIKVTVNYTNTDPVVLDAKQYRAEDKFKCEKDTYTIARLEQPRAKDDKAADLEFKYVITIDTKPVPEAVITTKLPIDKDLYITPDGIDGVAAEYVIDFEDNAGWYVEKQGWLHLKEDNEAHFDNEFEAGERYVMGMALTFDPRYGMYELPEDLKDIRFKINFTNTDAVRLTEDKYVAADEFEFEVGTYTLKVVEHADSQPVYELMYVIEIPKAEKPADPTDKPADVDTPEKPAKPETKPTDVAETTQKAENDKEVPDTGVVSGSVAAAVLAVSSITAGAAVALKKKNK